MERNYVVMDIDRYENQICRFYEHIKGLEEEKNFYRNLYHILHDATVETIEYIESEAKDNGHIIVVDTNKFLARLEAAAEYVPMRMTFDEPEAVTTEPPEGGQE